MATTVVNVDLVQQTNLDSWEADGFGGLDKTVVMKDGNFTTTAAFLFQRSSGGNVIAIEYTMNQGVSDLADGDKVQIFLGPIFSAGMVGGTPIHLYANSSADAVHVASRLSSTVVIGDGPAANAGSPPEWTEFTLDAGFRAALADLGSGKWKCRVAFDRAETGEASAHVGASEAQMEITLSGGGITRLGTASVTGEVLVGQAPLNFAFQATSENNEGVVVVNAATVKSARLATASVEGVVAVNSAVLGVSKPGSSSVEAIVTHNTPNLTVLRKATASVTAVVDVKLAVLEVGTEHIGSASVVGSVVVNTSDILYDFEASASVEGVVDVSTAPSLGVARLGTASVEGVVSVSTAPAMNTAILATADVEGTVTVNSATLSILRAKIDLATSKDLVGLESVTLFSDTENWWIL